MVVKTSNSGFEQPDDPFRRCKDARRLTQFSRAVVFERSSSKRCEFRNLGYYKFRDDNNIGYHAFRDKERAKREAFFHACWSPCVIGSVAMWGEVIEHQHGWRSEYAAVQSITEITGDNSLWSKQCLLQELREKYGCAAVTEL
jgi:hypothetical protein